LLLFQRGDALVGRGELMFEADDADSCSERHVLIKESAYPLGKAEFGAAVAALPAGGAVWGE